MQMEKMRQSNNNSNRVLEYQSRTDDHDMQYQ